MISPIVAPGLLAAAFLLGLTPGCLFGVSSGWGESLGWSARETERRLRRGFVFPAIVLLPCAGWLGDQWGAKDLTIVGLLILALCLTLLALSSNPRAATSNLLGVALGVSLVAIGVISWMPDVLGRRGRAVEAMNLGFIAISLGWLVAPRLTAIARRRFGPRGILLAAAFASVVSCFVLMFGDQPDLPASTTTDLFHDLRFWLLLLVTALYLPVESSLESWSRPFLRDLGDRRSLESHVFVFWCAYLSARLFTFWLVRTGFEPWFLLSCAAASAMILGNLVGTYGPSSGRIGYWCVGFCYGPLLPGFLGLFEQTFPDRFGVILGMLLALGTMYTTMLCPLLQRYAPYRTPREAMRVPVVLTLLVAAPLLLVTLMK